jgi:hypothetical protein
VLSSVVKRSPRNLSKKKQSQRLRLRKKRRRKSRLAKRLPPKPRRKKLQSLRRNPYQLKTSSVSRLSSRSKRLKLRT